MLMTPITAPNWRLLGAQGNNRFLQGGGVAQPNGSQPMGVQPYRPQAPPRAGAVPMQQPPFRAAPAAPAAAAPRPAPPSEDDKAMLPKRSIQLLLSSVDKEVTTWS